MRSRILAFAFGILIFLPLFDTLFGLSDGFSSTENRQLSAAPVLRLSTVRSFVRQFKTYYQENFGFRNPLFYAYSHWKYFGLQESPLPEKAVLGKNGWWYLGNNANQVIEQHRGLVPMPTDTLQAIATRLSRWQQKLAHRGIKLVLLIAPDAQTIYPENLPDWALPYARPSRLDQFMAYMGRCTTVPVVDVRDTLLAAKSVHPVYFQTNSHWNSFGAIVSTSVLIKRLQVDFPTLIRPRAADYEIARLPGYAGDLAALCMLQGSLPERNYCQVRVNKRLAVRHTDTLLVADNPYKAFRMTGPDSRQPRLLFVGDSFSEWLTLYMPAYFSQSYFVRSQYIDPALVPAERPDVVVVEIVERNLDWLMRL